MGDDSCSCCGTPDDRIAVDEKVPDVSDAESDRGHRSDAAAAGSITDRILSGEAPLETPLPDDLARALGTLVGEPRVETVEEWVDPLRDHVGGEIDVADLCHVAGETPHWGELDGQRHYFACFYDAVVLAALADRPVDVHTESPDGTVVEARAVGSDSLRADPATAVFSFGCATDAGGDGDPSHADVYDAVCPYVRAFPSVAAYDRWRRTVAAPTVATSLDGATDLAAALAD